MYNLLAATNPLDIGSFIVATAALATVVVNWINQKRQSNAVLHGEEVKAEASKQIAETAAEAEVEKAILQNFANALTALQERFDRLQTNFDTEQGKRRLLEQKVAELELELTRKQATIEQLQRDQDLKRTESEQLITALHDENLILHNKVKFLDEECSGLKADCALLRQQIAEMQQSQGNGEGDR